MEIILKLILCYCIYLLFGAAMLNALDDPKYRLLAWLKTLANGVFSKLFTLTLWPVILWFFLQREVPKRASKK